MSLKLNLRSVVLIGLHFDAKDFAGKGGGATMVIDGAEFCPFCG